MTFHINWWCIRSHFKHVRVVDMYVCCPWWKHHFLIINTGLIITRFKTFSQSYFFLIFLSFWFYPYFLTKKGGGGCCKMPFFLNPAICYKHVYTNFKRNTKIMCRIVKCLLAYGYLNWFVCYHGKMDLQTIFLVYLIFLIFRMIYKSSIRLWNSAILEY